MNENLGDTALKMLFKQFETNADSKPKNVVLKSELIIRDSVKNLLVNS